MIVPSMTLEEIRKEIEKDIPIVIRKMEYVSNDVGKKLSKVEKKNGFEYYYEYYSKYKNNWICRVVDKSDEIDVFPMLIYHNGIGHVSMTITPDMNIIYLTAHFIKRYNERCNLRLNTYNEIIRAYMRENIRYDIRKIEMVEPGIYKMFCVISSGIILGMLNNNIKLMKANTFIPNSMLNKNQSELHFMVANELEKYKHTSGILN